MTQSKTGRAQPMLGLDLGGTKIEAVMLAHDGTRLWRQRVHTPQGDYTGTVQAIAALVAQANVQAAALGLPQPSVGMGTPGSAMADGRMKNCNSQALNGQPLQADVQALIKRPIAMANDANCLALSEATDGAGAGAGVVFAAILGTGVGGGLAVHGRVLDGPNRLAGEWGHNPMPWLDEASDGPAPMRCYCGQHSCIEQWLSGPWLAAWHQRRLGLAEPGPNAQQLVEAAKAGDAQAMQSLHLHARGVARALASVINLLDPDVIVLGGGVSQMAHLYEQVPQLWSQWIFSGTKEAVHTRLAQAVHGDASGVRGAAWLGRALATA